MLTRAMAVLVIALVVVGGTAGVVIVKHMKQMHQEGTPSVERGVGQKSANESGKGRDMSRSHTGFGMGANKTCNNAGLNKENIGRNINWLFEHHELFHYNLTVYPKNKTIVWIILGPNRTALETLVSHIMQMECVLEHGGTPRPQDPLFVVDAQISSKYVHTKIEWINDTTIRVVKKADNECAFEVIKLHAEVVKGFFDSGRIEAQKTHEIPESIQQICAPYLNTTTVTS